MTRQTTPPAWASFAQQIGLRLHEARIAAGMSQEQLAVRAGITRATYSQLEKGLTRPGVAANPTIYTLVSLSQTLGLTLADLIPDEVPDVSRWAE
ncbi:MAG: helix-turn-helix domain-containing protein [Leucobacter sp.]